MGWRWNIFVFCGSLFVTLKATTLQGPNLALNGSVTQSSTLDGNGPARNAISGDRKSNYLNGECSHTTFETDPWWRVDLLGVYGVDLVSITNRGDCCPERLDRAEIHIGNSLRNNGNNNPRCAVVSDIPAGQTMNFQCEEMQGRYVNVFIPGVNRVLCLCEVEVYGTPVLIQKMRTITMRVQTSTNMTELFIQQQVLQQLNAEMMTKGLTNVTLSWKRSEGQVFHQEDDKE